MRLKWTFTDKPECLARHNILYMAGLAQFNLQVLTLAKTGNPKKVMITVIWNI